MNILISPEDFHISQLFLTDSKENTIMDGNFIKLIYSTDFLTFNGIFLDFIIKFPEKKIFNSKQYLFFNPENEDIIHTFERIEKSILELFIQINMDKNPDIINKNISQGIYKQLKNGIIKYYQYTNIASGDTPKYYIKISGIWETATQIGLTYKLIQY
jgi:hypothetical protein